MLGDVVRLAAQFGIFFHEGLHIFNGVEVGDVVGLSLTLVVVQELFNSLAQLSKIGMPVAAEKFVLSGCQNHFFQVFGNIGGAPENDAVVVEAQQLMNHCLVGPLRQEGCDRVVLTIKNEEHERVIRGSTPTKVEDLVRGDGMRHVLGELVGQRRGAGITNGGRLAFKCQQHGLESPTIAFVEVSVGVVSRSAGRGAEGDRVAAVESEQVLVDRAKVPIELLDLTNELLFIALGQHPQQSRGQNASKEEVVLGETRVLQLLREQAGVALRGPQEAHSLEVAGFRILLILLIALRVHPLQVTVLVRVVQSRYQVHVPRQDLRL
eukprot:scaffold59287_cov53-Attheya_sp.AAC.4